MSQVGQGVIPTGDEGDVRWATITNPVTDETVDRPTILLWWMPKTQRRWVVGGSKSRDERHELLLEIDPKSPKSLAPSLKLTTYFERHYFQHIENDRVQNLAARLPRDVLKRIMGRLAAAIRPGA